MAQQGQATIWTWSPALKCHYYYATADDELVCSNEARQWRMARPQGLTVDQIPFTAYDKLPNSRTAYQVIPGSSSSKALVPRTTAHRSSPEALASSFDRLTVNSQSRPIQASSSRRPSERSVFRGATTYAQTLNISDGPDKPLHASYKEREHKFFRQGRVFMILWPEPAGESGQSSQSNATYKVEARLPPGTSLGAYGEHVHTKTRRFIVFREASNYCLALPISTYAGQGVAKPTVTKSEHVIAFCGKAPPPLNPGELPRNGEHGMRETAIRIDPDTPLDKLDPMSRLDLGKISTVHHNTKVKSIGVVNDKSMGDFIRQASAVQSTQSTRSAIASNSTGTQPDAEDNDTLTLMRALLALGKTTAQARDMLDRFGQAGIKHALANKQTKHVIQAGTSASAGMGAKNEEPEEDGTESEYEEEEDDDEEDQEDEGEGGGDDESSNEDGDEDAAETNNAGRRR